MQEVMAYPPKHKAVLTRQTGVPTKRKSRALFGVCWALANFLGLELGPADYPDAFWAAVVKDLAQDGWRAVVAAREPFYGTPHNNFATNVVKVTKHLRRAAGSKHRSVHLRYMNLEKHPGGFLQTLRFDDAEALVEKSTTGVKWVLRNYQKWKVVPVQQPVREEH